MKDMIAGAFESYDENGTVIWSFAEDRKAAAEEILYYLDCDYEDLYCPSMTLDEIEKSISSDLYYVYENNTFELEHDSSTDRKLKGRQRIFYIEFDFGL